MALSILFDKKSAIDVYMSDTITLITSEYRYIHRKISDALKERNEETVIAALHKCVEHQCTLIEYEFVDVDISTILTNSI